MAGRFGSVNYGGSKRRTPLLGASGKLERTKISDSSSKTVLGGINQVFRAYLLQREKEEAKEKDAADRAAAMKMFKDYTKPQAEWDVEKYGSTPKTLRDAGFKVSMSDALGDQSLEGDEPADQNWMTGKESQKFYDEQAAKGQRDFDVENRYGIDALEDSYAPATGELSMIDKLMGKKKGTSEGPETMDMRYALMKDAVSEEGKRKARLLAEQDARVKFERGIQKEGRGHANAMELAAYKREKGGSDPTSNLRDFKELQRLQLEYPPDEKGNESPQVKTFRDFVSRTKIMNLGDRFQPYDVRLGQPAAIGTTPKVTIQNGQVIRVPGTPGDLGAPPASSSGTPGDLGTPPASSSSTPNTNTSGVTTIEIPKSREAREKESGRLKQTRRAGATVIQDLQRGLDIIQNDWSSLSSATAGIAKKIPLTDAKTLDGYIQSALSNVGLDTLQTMRENSPTGGALGQVPVQQQKRLEQVLGSLDIEQRPEIIEDNLKRIINIYKDISYGTPDEIMNLLKQGEITSEIAEGAKDRYELSFDEFGRKRGGNASPALNAAPSEKDILFTMKTHGMTREQVLQKLGIR